MAGRRECRFPPGWGWQTLCKEPDNGAGVFSGHTPSVPHSPLLKTILPGTKATFSKDCPETGQGPGWPCPLTPALEEGTRVSPSPTVRRNSTGAPGGRGTHGTLNKHSGTGVTLREAEGSPRIHGALSSTLWLENAQRTGFHGGCTATCQRNQHTGSLGRASLHGETVSSARPHRLTVSGHTGQRSPRQQVTRCPDLGGKFKPKAGISRRLCRRRVT